LLLISHQASAESEPQADDDPAVLAVANQVVRVVTRSKTKVSLPFRDRGNKRPAGTAKESDGVPAKRSRGSSSSVVGRAGTEADTGDNNWSEEPQTAGYGHGRDGSPRPPFDPENAAHGPTAAEVEAILADFYRNHRG
jgi:hypothetical protein